MALLLGIEIYRMYTKHQERTESLETFDSCLANFNHTQRIAITPHMVTLLPCLLELGWCFFSRLWESTHAMLREEERELKYTLLTQKSVLMPRGGVDTPKVGKPQKS